MLVASYYWETGNRRNLLVFGFSDYSPGGGLFVCLPITGNSLQNMPYITNSTQKRLISEIDTRSINLKGDIYKGFGFNFLNELEKKFLLATKMFFENPDGFLGINYKKCVPHKDTYIYAEEYSGQVPAYHKIKECKKLANNFKNFVIPVGIEGIPEIERFRKWYKEEGFELIERGKKQLFIDRLFIKFKTGLTASSLHDFIREYPNSGIRKETKAISEIEKDIENIISQINDYIDISEKNKMIMAKFLRSSYLHKRSEKLCVEGTNFSDKEIKEVLKVFETELKSNLVKKLKEYYWLNNNKELEFKEKFLDDLGLSKCTECYKDSILPPDF